MIDKLSDLVPRVSDHVPGCPENAVLQALRDGWRRFCYDSRAWRSTLPSLDLVAEQKEYNLLPRFDAEIERVYEVRVPSEDNVTDGEEGPELESDYWEVQTTAAGVTQLKLGYEPSEAVSGGLIVKAVLLPNRDVQEAEDPTFLNRWADAVTWAAVLDLAARPGRRWTSPTEATLAQSRYRTEVNRARADVDRARKPASPGLTA